MKYHAKISVIISAAVMLLLGGWCRSAQAGDAWLDANGIRIDNVNLNGQHVSNGTYWIDPPFLSAKVRPNVLFVLDNSGSMNSPAYTSEYDPTQFVSGMYFGYFDSTKMYEYASNKWTPTTKDPSLATATNPIASGDFLNWAYMTRIEAAKKLMIGGKANPRSMNTGCCVRLTGESSAQRFSKDYDNSVNAVGDKKIYPFTGRYRYSRRNDYIEVSPLATGTTHDISPNGVLSSTAAWVIGGSSPAPTTWQSVDESPNDDGDTTMIYNRSTKDAIIFDYPGTTGSGSIQSVTIKVVAKKSQKNQSMYLTGVLRVDGSLYASAAVQLSSTRYQTYNVGQFTYNPRTGLPWSWNDIKSVGGQPLQGFGFLASDVNDADPTNNNYATITQVWIIIDASMPSGGPYSLNVDTGTAEIRGILDDLSTDARFGLAFYNSSAQGGKIDTYVDFGTPTSMITSVGNLIPSTWTPLGETLHEMVRYFRQDAPYYTNSPADYQVGQNYDPYYFQYTHLAGSGLDDQYVPCAKSFILLLTDGEPTQDLWMPANLKDYDGDGRDDVVYASNGTDYLDDVALWARTEDHRTDLEGEQNVMVYSVFMFGKGSRLLMDTAVNGGFDDLDGDMRPSCEHPADAGSPTQDELRECYRDTNGNGTLDPFDPATNVDGDLPLTYFQGDDGYELQVSIIDAITAILKRAASGTSVSVLGSSWKGEGSMYQAYFYPEKVEGLRRVKWTGYFHSLFVDRHGLIHEDTNGDARLVPNDDYVVEFEYQAGADTRVKYFYDKVDNNTLEPIPDGKVDSSVPIQTVTIPETSPVWDAGKLLARHAAVERTIYTSIDADVAAPPTTPPTLISFSGSNAAQLRPYIRAKTSADAENLINFIRGEKIPLWRDRDLTVDGVLNTWKLGDIVFSDPTVVAAPKERFDIIYNDESYRDFYEKWKKRRTVVYVGGNDGMLHAFNGGFFVSTTAQNPAADVAQVTFCEALDPTDETRCSVAGDATNYLGKELWGFIPYDLLPHLAWLADPDYNHVYYVDNMVRVTDARVFAPDNDVHINGWGTIVLVSLRFGGGEIDVTDSFGAAASTTKQFKSAYYALDVTDPEHPQLMWRFTEGELGFTLSTPAIVREEENNVGYWYAVIGSGPSNYRGGRAIDTTTVNTKFTKTGVVGSLPASTTMNTTNPHLFVIDLGTGRADPSWTASGGLNPRPGVFKQNNVFRYYTSVTAVDYPLDYKYDMVYFGSIGCNWGCQADGYATQWAGNVVRLKTRNFRDPAFWVLSNLINVALPVTVKPAVGLDSRGNVWVYFGTGRFLHVDDRFETTAQTYYGIKDRCYVAACTNLVNNSTNILNSNNYQVQPDGSIQPSLLANALGTNSPRATISRFDDLANFMRDWGDGWKIQLAPGERVIVNGFVVGGISGFGSYLPTQTVCEFEGRSRQYYPYYLTGTVPYIPGGQFMYDVSVDSGGGLPSIPAVHIDSAGNVKLFLQKSTGEIQVLEMKQAQTVTGGFGAGGESAD